MKTRLVNVRRLAPLLLCLLALAGPLESSSPSSNASVELHVKAAYLFNFGRYVSWPAQSGDVVIGVLGHDSIVEVLEKTISGKTINGRAYRVRIFAAAEQIDRCDILYLPHLDSRHTASILSMVSGKPILTVSDLDNFSNDGGMIEFHLLEDTLKFDINIGAAEKSGLKISSELLRVAHDIKGRHR